MKIWMFPSFSWDISSHVTRFDQSRASEDIWWIIITNVFVFLGNISASNYQPIGPWQKNFIVYRCRAYIVPVQDRNKWLVSANHYIE